MLMRELDGPVVVAVKDSGFSFRVWGSPWSVVVHALRGLGVSWPEKGNWVVLFLRIRLVRTGWSSPYPKPLNL